MNSISVLLSIYHKENKDYLKKSLHSIWHHQTVKPKQIVIVKDGPLTKDLDEILNDFSKIAPVDFVINEKNIGLSASLNKGLKACKYDLVARMDTDDIAYSERFEKQLAFINENPSIDILGSFATKIDEKGEILSEIKVPISNELIYKYIWTCPFIHPSVMFKKSQIIKVGSYNSGSGPRQDDYELWFRCATNGLRFANLNEPLIYYRFFYDSIKKNNIKVGWHRFKVGFKGSRKLKLPLIAYVGITVPFIRSLLPYPLNFWFQKFMDNINPRSV